MEEKVKDRKDILGKIKRVVVKVGTSSLTTPEGNLDREKLKSIVSEIVKLRKKNLEVILVTSGAIGAGVHKLKLKSRPRDMPLLQACAAVGQNILMHAYETYFRAHQQLVAQVLLTKEDFFERKRYLNARNTLQTLLRLGVVPIVNQNDTVAVDEIRFGDNDTLSALVAASIQAELLVLLSDVEGLYTRDPTREKKARFIPKVKEISKEMLEHVSSKSRYGFGGMRSKLEAANLAMRAGIVTVIAKAERKNVLVDIVNGKEVGTLFLPKKRLSGREVWLMFASRTKGAIVVDDGAKESLTRRGGSLLPSGIKDIEGKFEVGDTVAIKDLKGKIFAKGFVNYSYHELEKIKGLHSSSIKKILGYCDYKEAISRDNMVFIS